MLLNWKPFQLLNEQDLIELISSQASEGKNIEFKRTLPSYSDSDTKEFLYDISSFANASGGFVIFGMEENQGVASKLIGIPDINPDQEILRLENLVRTGIAPRIHGLAIRSLSLSNDTYAIIISIPNSWASPHMVTIKGTSRFFIRNSAGKHQMDVDELRQAFLLTDNISNRIKEFRLSRIGKIISEETPIPMSITAKIILHSIPISAFETSYHIDINLANRNINKLNQYISGTRFNLDGLLTYFQFGISNTLYYQIFRSGIIETIDDSILNPQDNKLIIPSFDFDNETIQTFGRILKFQESLGIEPPTLLFLTLINVKNYSMGINPAVVYRSVINSYNKKLIEMY